MNTFTPQTDFVHPILDTKSLCYTTYLILLKLMSRVAKKRFKQLSEELLDDARLYLLDCSAIRNIFRSKGFVYCFTIRTFVSFSS